ncbi:MAG: adenylate/guanylate cyclase domain-containing protein, partial [Bdellovibrionaceae bacterium]|nr:adenylate/guanylate cyclase domain-containing protein [Pseudobdellovibrionaceae bacterium]
IDIIDNNSGEKVFSIPVNRNGELLINYAGERSMFPYANAADIIDESKPTVRITEKVFRDGRWIDEIKDYPKSEWIKDKIFIFGVTAIAVFDLRVTPFDENFPGAETHVNVVDNLIRKDFLQPLEKADLFTSGFVLLISIFLTLALSYSGAVVGFVISGLTIFGIALGDKLFFFDKGVVTPIIFPIIASLSIYVILTFYKYFTEERKKKELKGTFSKYVSPSIVDEVLKDPENLQLGGRKQMMSVFFSDVRGFTTISEQLDPQALSDLLNSYLTPMTDLVFQNKGTLDKYMGDAVMAFFGAPISYPDHAAAACRCAIQSLVKLKELQKEYEAKGLPMIDIGIGINTGEMSVGNMGSETVRNYTVMGDAVNLGSRLEGINKQYGTRIIISEYTHEHVKDQFLCREIDWVRVKGKVEPVKIFELIAEGSAPSAIEEVVSHFNEGFALYHQRQFKEAVEEFNKNLQIDPEDGPTQLYIDRCQNYIENPPESDWDGVFTMTTK